MSNCSLKFDFISLNSKIIFKNEKAKIFYEEIRNLKRTDLTTKLLAVTSWEFGKVVFLKTF